MTAIESNKGTARALLEVAFDPNRTLQEKRELLPRFLNQDKYIQHCPTMEDGFEGLMKLLSSLNDTYDDYGIEVKRLIAEDDFVVAHCLYKFGGKDPVKKVIVEIFRVEDGRMVEHWDAIQDVPANPANSNGMI